MSDKTLNRKGDKLLRINQAIGEILAFEKPQVTADSLGVSTAMISTWKNKENDQATRG